MSAELPDRFLSEEDLDLRSLSWEELLIWWDRFLQAAQASNDLDEFEYSHGVFAIPRRDWPEAMRPPIERDGLPAGPGNATVPRGPGTDGSGS